MRETFLPFNSPLVGQEEIKEVIAALESGKIAAYATDVWPKDPPDSDYPLLRAPNVFMSPHLGASSKENLLRIGDEVCERIEAFLGGDA